MYCYKIIVFSDYPCDLLLYVYDYTYYDTLDLIIVWKLFLSRGTTQLASPIAQHKTNIVDSLMRAVREFISMILIQCLPTNI